MITFFVTKDNNKNIIFFMSSFNSEEDRYEIQKGPMPSGAKEFFKLYLDDKLTKNTPIQVINQTSKQLIASGYVYQLLDYIRAEKSFLLNFNSKGFGLMIPVSIFKDVPSETDESIENIGNTIKARYNSQKVKVVFK